MSDPVIQLIPLYRVLMKDNYNHTFTTDAGERDKLLADGNKSEGTAALVMPNSSFGAVPLYRATNNGVDNLCTTSLAEYEEVLAAGYKAQSHAGYIFPTGVPRLPGQIPLFRVTNPGIGNILFYSTDRAEIDRAIKTGGYQEQPSPGYVYSA